MSELKQDLRFAIRMLRRAPVFTVITVITLALGIGANTALFSVVRTVLLEPLPYGDAGRIAMIWSSWTGFDKTWVSEGEYHGYRESLRSFEDIALFQQFEVSLTEGQSPERITAVNVTPNTFVVLGVEPMLGRPFLEEEAQPNGPAVVILGHEAWQRRYGGDPAVIGRTISVNGSPQEIVGVMPPGFRMPIDFRSAQPTEAWFPYALSVPPGPVPFRGGSHGSYAVGRLRPGVTEEDANRETAAYVARLAADGTYPEDWNFRATVVTAANEVAGGLRTALLVLLGAVGLVLVIACVNVANLLLVRGEDRQREIGVRTALGAARWRITRQLLVESLVLAVAGGIAGTWLAWIGIASLRRLAPVELPRVSETTIDPGVLAFTGVLCVLTAALFGLLPALQASRADVQSVLRESGRANTAGVARSRLRRMLVAGEVALAIVLAVGSGLMLRSFWRLVDIDPGFRTDNVLTMRLSVPSAFYPDDADVSRFFGDLLTRVRALPGVEDAGLVRVLPIDQTIGDSCVEIEGYVPPPGECAPADWQAASDGYFEAMGMRLVEGRFIESGDTRESAQVIVVNEAFVRRYFADRNALGGRVRFAFNDSAVAQTVVGIVGDARHNGITAPTKATFYRPHAQWVRSTGFPQRTMNLVVHTARDAGTFTAPVRDIVRALDARLPLSSVQTMDAVLARSVAQPRFTLILLLAFGGLALALAVVGIYGVVSHTVSARRQELGIRMALGAAPRDVIRLTLWQGLGFALIGVAAGTVGAFLLTRLMRDLMYEVTTTDAVTYVAVAALGLVTSLVASWLPARRASKTDPLTALRAE